MTWRVEFAPRAYMAFAKIEMCIRDRRRGMSSITERENVLLSLLGYEMFQQKLQIDAVVVDWLSLIHI